jgi:hypothetical protein
MSRRVSTLAYECLSVEGGLLPPEWFARLAQSSLEEMRPEDYRLPAGLQLRDEISRAWTIGRAWWQRYAKAREGHDPDSHHAVKAATVFAQGLLREVFGFQTLQPIAGALLVEGRQFQVTLQALQGRVPIVVAGWGESLDAPLERLKDGRRRSPFGMLQDYLNASPASMWGIVLNGRSLRLLRDNAALTRPAWVEADLERLFAGENHADFAALWLLLHETRFGLADADPADGWLERQRTAALQEGTRAREKLREGVTQALRELGCGFLKHPGNDVLRESLRSGAVSEAEYYAELLRLIYRFLFVVTVEERGLLHPEGSSATARARYREGFALLPLRDRAARTVLDDGHHDLWLRACTVFDGLGLGQPALALPAFGGLFDPGQTPHLSAASLANRSLLRALRALTWVPVGKGLARVNWRDMGAEELGSVYESLLELVPQIRIDEPDPFRFVGDQSSEEGAEGNARKLSGSYYTPDSLVQVVLDSALEPVIAARVEDVATNPDAAAEALLSITCIDPAMGSGHFLLGAARRLASHLARLRTDGTPSAAQYRAALRDVITHCIYGTDKNALAVELARMALWLEAATPEAPLGFIDHHLRHGDALLGLIDPGVLHDGIPDEAYDALAADERATTSMLKRRNRQERTSLEAQRRDGPQMGLLPTEPLGSDEYTALEKMPDDTPERLAAKRAQSEALAARVADSGVMLAANLYVAAFLLPKRANGNDVPTTRDVVAALQGQKVPDQVRRAAEAVAQRERFTHWKLTFPQVFACGGFDVVIGNPPWEKVKLSEKEFFATRAPDIANARSASERKRAIEQLADAPPGSVEAQLFENYMQALRSAEGTGAWLHTADRFGLTGRGDVNLYAVFAETMMRLADDLGRSGIIVPTGIATDDSTKAFFGYISSQGRLVSLFDFENRDAIFPSVHRSYKFCLLTLGRAPAAEFVFFAMNVRQLQDPRRRFRLSSDEFALINPNTLTCPVFRSERDAELAKKIYRDTGVFVHEHAGGGGGNPWGVSFARLFDLTNDSAHFNPKPSPSSVPLVEGKMVQAFDHRAASVVVNAANLMRPGQPLASSIEQLRDPNFRNAPQNWVDRAEAENRLAAHWDRDWLLCFKDVTSATNERTFIATVVPFAGIANSLIVVIPSVASTRQVAALYANLNALVFDFVTRTKVGGLHLNYFLVKQLPVIPPGAYHEHDLAFLVPRVLELSYTSSDMVGWARDLGYELSPYSYEPQRRSILRAELDAWFAHKYGLTRDELRYVLDPADVLGEDYPSETFRVLKKNDIAQYGEYRTARLVLEAWDRVVEPARRAGGNA